MPVNIQSAKYNTLFQEVAKQLGVERKVYSPVYRPQTNSHIEGFHKFLKECICKHMVNNLEWDDILPFAAAAHNWFPNELLCTGCHPHTIVNPAQSMIRKESQEPMWL